MCFNVHRSPLENEKIRTRKWTKRLLPLLLILIVMAVGCYSEPQEDLVEPEASSKEASEPVPAQESDLEQSIPTGHVPPEQPEG